jgi:hypothetical protein
MSPVFPALRRLHPTELVSAAAALGDRATLTRLVSGLGLSITAPDGYGMTPLMWACTAPPATAAGTVASVLGLLGAPDDVVMAGESIMQQGRLLC